MENYMENYIYEDNLTNNERYSLFYNNKYFVFIGYIKEKRYSNKLNNFLNGTEQAIISIENFINFREDFDIIIKNVNGERRKVIIDNGMIDII